MTGSHAADRTAFLSALDADLARDPSSTVVVRLDLDRFSRIRETFGATVSRAVRTVLTGRLEEVCGPRGRILTYGEDAFVALVPVTDPSAEGLEELGMRLIQRISAPVDVPGEPPIAVGSNVGISAAASFDQADALRLLTGAELAIQQANALGSRRSMIYQVATTDDPTRLPHLYADMLGAIERGEFQPYFQPVVSLPSATIAGAEALIRWVHPRHDVIQPAEFIPEAEKSGLVRDLDALLWERACAVMRDLPFGGGLSLSVNLSPADLDFPELITTVERILGASGLPAERLILEVTETALSQDWSRARRRLAALRGMGVRIAVDDFGAGHMYLDRLGTGLFDILKIDRSIVAPAGEPETHQAALLTAVTSLAQRLGMSVVAEGLETPDQLARVTAAGCDYGQGYLFGHPMPARAYAELVAATCGPAPH